MHYEYDDGLVRISTVEALNNLVPQAKWSIVGYEYSGIEWQDEEVNQPSEEEVYNEVEKLNSDYLLKEYQRLRAAEYPPIEDYIDGVVKGDQDQIDKYIAECLAVKEKYPKPTES